MLQDIKCNPTGVGLYAAEPIRLAGLISAFDDHPTITVVLGDLEVLLTNTSFHLLILDMGDRLDRLELQSKVKRVRPDIRQLVLGPMDSDELILRSIIAGARGYIDSGAGPYAVRMAAEAVLQGSVWAPRRLLSQLIDRLLNQQDALTVMNQVVLSPQERQVLDLIMTAHSNREIATNLGIEERTVKAYVANLLRKTGSENRVTLSVQATQESMREKRVRAVGARLTVEAGLGPGASALNSSIAD